MRVRAIGSFSSSSRNFWSQAVLLKPQRSALDLVRQAAGGDHHDLQILSIALDSVAGIAWPSLQQRAALGTGNCSTPICSGMMVSGHSGSCGQEDRQRREAAVVQALVLEEGHVEFVGHQGVASSATGECAGQAL